MKFLLPVIIALVLISGYFVLSKNGASNIIPKSSGVQSQNPPSQAELSSLRNYMNSSLKFSLNYPNNWQILESGTDVIFATTKESLGKDETRKEELRVFVGRTSLLQDQNLAKYISVIDARSTPIILDKKNISISQNEAVRRTVDLGNYKAIVIYVQYGTKIYTISATPADSALMPVFDQMLQSFKFLP